MSVLWHKKTGKQYKWNLFQFCLHCRSKPLNFCANSFSSDLYSISIALCSLTQPYLIALHGTIISLIILTSFVNQENNELCMLYCTVTVEVSRMYELCNSGLNKYWERILLCTTELGEVLPPPLIAMPLI